MESDDICKTIEKQNKATRSLIVWIVALFVVGGAVYNFIQLQRFNECMDLARSAIHETYCASRYPTMF